MNGSCIPQYSPNYLESVYIVKVREKEGRSIDVIKKAVSRRAAVALSGKDSLVALHLALSAGVDVDVVISAYAADRRLPQSVVDELADIARRLGAHVVIYDKAWDVHASLFNIIANHYGYGVIISGLRRRENRGHNEIEYYKWGLLVNPIIDWTVAEVWSYIYKHNLPVPSVYCSALFPETSLQHLVL
jgi:3'-phosphoadenosine 5'-phosphosulfate sulfotransferase (PAPS reductase)/FAD synthetase